jgi:hypothetical protein
MITYSVVVAKDHGDYTDEELTLQTYSNYQAASLHEQFVVDCDMVVDGWKWDYVFIRETRVADVFEKEST